MILCASTVDNFFLAGSRALCGSILNFPLGFGIEGGYGAMVGEGFVCSFMCKVASGAGSVSVMAFEAATAEAMFTRFYLFQTHVSCLRVPLNVMF